MDFSFWTDGRALLWMVIISGAYAFYLHMTEGDEKE
jgi:hypothetical protein